MPLGKQKRYLYALALFLLIGFGGYYLYDEYLVNKAVFDPLDLSVSKILEPDFDQPYTPDVITVQDETGNQVDDDLGSLVDSGAIFDPNGKYAVQVAVCMFQSCINEHSYHLRQNNYVVKTFGYNVRGNYFEVISDKTYSQTDAEQLSSQINRINRVMGNAVPIKVNDGYKITLGSFFFLEDFKRVKQIVENNLPINLVHNTKRERAQTYRVVAGPFRDKKSAETANEEIKNVVGFDQSFVVDVSRF